MKTIFKAISALVVGISLSATAADFTLPKYKKVVLDNGLTVYLMKQDEVPLINVSLVVKAGATKDGKAAGLATLTANNLLFGTEKLSKSEIEDQLDFVGASVNANANKEYSSVNASFAKKDVDLVMEIIRDAVTKPKFDDKEFEQFKQRHLTGLQQAKESPRSVIGDYFNLMVFGNHPYSAINSGTADSVDAIDVEGIKAFHKKWYVPKNSAIAVAGDFNVSAMETEIVKLFGGWKGGNVSSKALSTASEPTKSRVMLVNKSDAIESTFMIGAKGIKRSNPDYVAVSVINTILGGRFTSWLNDELRVNSGLSYGARSRFNAMSSDGSFYISTFTKSSTTKEAIDLALKTYNRLWEKGVDKETLESAKAYVKGQFPPRYETASQLASLMGQMFVYGYNESFINTFADQVNTLDTKTASRIIDKYFPKENLQFVVVGKADDIREIVSAYGEVTEVDIKGEMPSL